jgi:hypothetical protein
MAARTRRIFCDDNTRAKIQTTQIIKRLMGHILGEIKLESSQVTAALGLLKKTIPDLSAVEVSGELEQTHKVVSGEPLSEREWATQYGSGMETPARPAKSTH